ncbi:MAG: hypothetical protein HKP30_00635 [Myxococcales bacterium]|nr:hypothetical protein [Myxococcales bacterium]
MTETAEWRRCNACKEPIPLGATYWVCSVSTCNRKRTGLRFCSVTCWDVHLPTANHREAWAVEKTAPTTAEPEEPAAAKREAAGGRPKRRILPTPQQTAAAAPAPRDEPLEVLIVASRLKEFIRARSGFNTSDRVLEPLSKIVRRVCEEAIENARRDERKTVLDRDIPK